MNRHIHPGDSKATQLSWVCWLLPYIEQGNIRLALDFESGWSGWNGDPTNTPLGATPIKTLICPTSSPNVRLGLYNNGASNVFAYGDYIPVEKVAPTAPGAEVTTVAGNKSQGYGILSNINRSAPTLLRSTRKGSTRGRWSKSRTERLPRSCSWKTAAGHNCTRRARRSATRPPPPPPAGPGFAPVPAKSPTSPAPASMARQSRCPCAVNCSNDNQPFSLHEGGLNLLFCDGSVKFVNQAVTARTFAALVTYCGGEILTDY